MKTIKILWIACLFVLMTACGSGVQDTQQDTNNQPDPAKGSQWDKMKWDQGKWG
ncbi:MAG: hypothetical protein OEZ58_01835 [Gammaproteobacteria bacterium]|nr:hypothetical protein [Gammaproteobacteria bacterium]MDH5727702.1 hypothetical protein [Gammaproteobacteria bacterium]